MKKQWQDFKTARLNRVEQLEFLDYLQNSLQNGFSLANSIELMAVLWQKRHELMLEVAQEMNAGARFTDELMKLGFSKTTVMQIQLALSQGNLCDCLQQLTKINRLKNAQIKKIKVELTYPFVLAGMMVILLVFMQTFVSSQFTEQQEYFGDLMLSALILLTLGGIYYFAKILNLLAKQDYQSMKKLSKYPYIGPTIKKYVEYLLVYDLGLLLASGFSLQKICLYAAKQEEGSLQQYVGASVKRKLEQGSNLQEIIHQEEFLPDNLLLLLKSGANREKLSTSCLILGQSLFNDLTLKIEKLVVSIQPLCFILLGLCILGMYLKLLLPMYAMMQGIN